MLRADLGRGRILALLLALLIVVPTVLAVAAIKYYRLVEVRGVVKKGITAVKAISIDLGTLENGTYFSVTNTTIITVGEGGANITDIRLGIKNITDLEEAFKDLFVDIVVAGHRLYWSALGNGFFIILGQQFKSDAWKFLYHDETSGYDIYEWTTYSFYSVSLEPGVYNIFIEVYGMTAAPTRDITISFVIFLGIQTSS